MCKTVRVRLEAVLQIVCFLRSIQILFNIVPVDFAIFVTIRYKGKYKGSNRAFYARLYFAGLIITHVGQRRFFGVENESLEVNIDSSTYFNANRHLPS